VWHGTIASSPLALESFTEARTGVNAVELVHVGVCEPEADGAGILGDALTMRRFRQHHKVVLEPPADQDLRRRLPDPLRECPNSGVGQMSAGSQRAVGLGHQTTPPVLLDQFLSIAEGVELDLVGDRSSSGAGEDLLELGDAEV